MDEKNKKKKWKGLLKYIPIVLFFCICFIGGIYLGKNIGEELEKGKSLGSEIAYWVIVYLWAFAAFYIHIIVHEAGHLVFGIKSGYKFSSFRIMTFMWLKEEGKIKLKRLKIAGTGGQCLMIPPQLKDGKIPVMLYNFGGSLMNFIVSVLSIGIVFVVVGISGTVINVRNPLICGILVFAAVGLIIAAMNAVPINVGMINNDGYNALTLRKNKEAMHAFWIQLMVNAEIAKGYRLKDMPNEWFVIPSDEAMKNAIVSVVGVFACNRLMDEGKYEEADNLMKHIMDIESGIVDLHRKLLVCDRMFCEIIGENRREVIDEMYTDKQKSFMKTMKKFPTVLRTEYAYALCVERNEEKADDILDYFDRYMKIYPYKSDVESERELIAAAKEKYLA